MINQLYIRADGGPAMGMGHVTRCIALAHMLKENFHVSFFSREIPENVVGNMKKEGFAVKKLESEDEFFSSLNGNEIVVLDHYELDEEYQKKIKLNGNKLICIDDLHDREFYADLVINPAPGISEKDYQGQAYTTYALGLDHVLLRPPFLNAAKKEKTSRNRNSLFLCFGGSDYHNLTAKCLKIATSFKEFEHISVVVGAANQHFREIKGMSERNRNIHLSHNLEAREMLSLMENSFLAVVPASGILLEALAARCTVVTGIYAKNQKYAYDYYKNLEMIIDGRTFDEYSVTKALAFGLEKKESTIPVIDGLSDIRIKRKVNRLLLN